MFALILFYTKHSFYWKPRNPNPDNQIFIHTEFHLILFKYPVHVHWRWQGGGQLSPIPNTLPNPGDKAGRRFSALLATSGSLTEKIWHESGSPSCIQSAAPGVWLYFDDTVLQRPQSVAPCYSQAHYQTIREHNSPPLPRATLTFTARVCYSKCETVA